MIAQRVFDLLRSKQLVLVTAESCTGGMIAAAITDIAGSSEVFDRGFVTYSNVAKVQMLGIAPDLLRQHGAVSEAVACAMAKGALTHSTAGISIAVTGIAGPAGGSAEKPVGLVHFACALRGGATRHDKQIFKATDRAGIRLAARDHALAMIAEALT